MGEAKDKQARRTPFEEEMIRLERELADRGALIEAGWASLRKMWLKEDTPPVQVEMLRWAFMAGSHHTFSSIMSIMDPGDEPTQNDLARMDKIALELEAFAAELKMRFGRPAGQA